MTKTKLDFESSADLAVRVANGVLDLHDQVTRLTEEVKELRHYRQAYSELLNSSIEHSRHMMGGLLQLALKPGVMDAIAQANEGRP